MTLEEKVDAVLEQLEEIREQQLEIIEHLSNLTMESEGYGIEKYPNLDDE